MKFFHIGPSPPTPGEAEAVRGSERGPLCTPLRALHLLPTPPRLPTPPPPAKEQSCSHSLSPEGVLLAASNRDLRQQLTSTRGLFIMSHYQKPQGWGSWGWKFLGSVPAPALPSQPPAMSSLGSSCGPRTAAAAHRGQNGENVSVLHK